MALPIKYRDTLAMPGSQLHELLSKGDHAGALKCYGHAVERHYEELRVASIAEAVSAGRIPPFFTFTAHDENGKFLGNYLSMDGRVYK